MSSDLIQQAVSSNYAVTQQKMQIAMIKAENEMNEAMLNMLTEAVDNGRSIAASSTHGVNINVEI